MSDNITLRNSNLNDSNINDTQVFVFVTKSNKNLHIRSINKLKKKTKIGEDYESWRFLKERYYSSCNKMITILPLNRPTGEWLVHT